MLGGDEKKNQNQENVGDAQNSENILIADEVGHNAGKDGTNDIADVAGKIGEGDDLFFIMSGFGDVVGIGAVDGRPGDRAKKRGDENQDNDDIRFFDKTDGNEKQTTQKKGKIGSPFFAKPVSNGVDPPINDQNGESVGGHEKSAEIFDTGKRLGKDGADSPKDGIENKNGDVEKKNGKKNFGDPAKNGKFPEKIEMAVVGMRIKIGGIFFGGKTDEEYIKNKSDQDKGQG